MIGFLDYQTRIKKRKYILSKAIPYGLFFLFLNEHGQFTVNRTHSRPTLLGPVQQMAVSRPLSVSNVFVTQKYAVTSFIVFCFSLKLLFCLFHFYSRAAQCFVLPAKPYNQSLILKKEKWDARSFFFQREGRNRERKVSQIPHRIGRIEVVPIPHAPLLYDMVTRQPHHLLLSSYNDLITSGNRPRKSFFSLPIYFWSLPF